MPQLGDYLGQILSEITIARMHADLEAVRVAELYAGHPLLRHMPVPHFRLPTVEVDVPVVINRMDETTEGEPPRGTPSLAKMRKTFEKVLNQHMSANEITLRPEAKDKLKALLDKKADSLAQPKEVAIDLLRIADELAATASSVLSEKGGPVDPRRRPELEKALQKKARMEFFKMRTQLSRLNALVKTAEVREAGPSENIARLRLKVTEEAFEWTTVELDGKNEDRLVTE